jgi:hypothetical protein
MARFMRLLAAVALPGMMFSAAPVDAAMVYCKTMGVPKGCVVRHTTVRPVVHRHVVYCKTRGVPKGCVMR